MPACFKRRNLYDKFFKGDLDRRKEVKNQGICDQDILYYVLPKGKNTDSMLSNRGPQVKVDRHGSDFTHRKF